MVQYFFVLNVMKTVSNSICEPASMTGIRHRRGSILPGQLALLISAQVACVSVITKQLMLLQLHSKIRWSTLWTWQLITSSELTISVATKTSSEYCVKLTWVDPLSAVSVLTGDVTPHERCLVTGYYYISGVQLKATDINNTIVPADFKNILTWPRNCRCCCFCRTTTVAALPWIYVMLYQDVAIYRHATVKQNLTCYRGPMN